MAYLNDYQKRTTNGVCGMLQRQPRYTHTYIHAYTHTYIHTYVRTYIYTCMHAYMQLLCRQLFTNNIATRTRIHITMQSISAMAIRTFSPLIARAALRICPSNQLGERRFSGLAIRIISALIARAALRIDVIAVSPPRSPKSVKQRYRGVMCI